MSRRYAALIVFVLVAACATPPGSAAPNPSSGSAAPNSTTVVVALAAVPQNLDVVPFGGRAQALVETAGMSHLFAYDTSGLPGNGCDQLAPPSAVVGQLADSWSFSPDRKTITIKLKDATSAWGHKLSADDVVYSFERNLQFESVGAGVLQSDVHYANPAATAVDERTVELHVDEPTAIDLAVLTLNVTQIYDSQELKSHATADDPWANKWLQTNTADFGPWKLENYVPGEQASFVPNPNYTGPRGNIARLIFQAIPDASSRANIVQTGEVDFAMDVGADNLKNLEGKPDVTTKVCRSPNRDMLVMNFVDPHFSDVRVRRAISLAIDREALNLGAYEGLATPAKYGVSTAYEFTPPSTEYLYDPTQAKSLLEQAGYPSGFAFELTYSPTRPGPQAEQMAVLIKDQLSQIGIDVSLRNVASNSTFIDDYYAAHFQAILYAEPSAVADVYYSAAAYAISTSAQDVYGWKDPAFDELVHTLGVTQPGPERDAMIQQVATQVVDLAPLIYLMDTPWMYAYRSNISGFNAVPYGMLAPSEMVKE